MATCFSSTYQFIFSRLRMTFIDLSSFITMSKVTKSIFFLWLIISANGFNIRRELQNAAGMTERMLDAMENLMTGDGAFDESFKRRLEVCMQQTSPQLKDASDLAWAGMLNYFNSNGQPGDEWGSCLGTGHCTKYFEQNATSMNDDMANMVIYEPCNFASNLAYYHVTLMLCEREEVTTNWRMPRESVRALGESFSHLAMGSAFWHGSHTLAGNVFDNRGIEILAFIIYQAGVANFPNYDAPTIRDLQSSPRSRSGVEVNDQLTAMFLNQPVEEWTVTMQNLELPSYYMSFAGIITTVLTLTLEETQVNTIVDELLKVFNLPEEDLRFLLDDLMPALRAGSANISISLFERLKLLKDLVSAAIKLMYAFLWQEWVVTSSPMIFDPAVNELGNSAIPTVNAFANSLNDWTVYDVDLQMGERIFPAFERCNDFNPHSKWHQEAAAGLMDLIYLGNDIYTLTEKYSK